MLQLEFSSSKLRGQEARMSRGCVCWLGRQLSQWRACFGSRELSTESPPHIPQKASKLSGVPVCSYTPSTGETEAGRSLEFLASHSSLFGQLETLSWKGGLYRKDDIWDCSRPFVCTHIHTHAHTQLGAYLWWYRHSTFKHALHLRLWDGSFVCICMSLSVAQKIPGGVHDRVSHVLWKRLHARSNHKYLLAVFEVLSTGKPFRPRSMCVPLKSSMKATASETPSRPLIWKRTKIDRSKHQQACGLLWHSWKVLCQNFWFKQKGSREEEKGQSNSPTGWLITWPRSSKLCPGYTGCTSWYWGKELVSVPVLRRQ